MRTIGVVTVGRSDYGIYQPLLRRLEADPNLRLVLFVSGMHLAPAFGLTVREVEKDGFEIAARIEMLESSDTPEAIAKSIGQGVTGFAQAFARTPPDLLLVLGDRFEMMSAALAALPFKIPVAHLHGGELTQGAIDDALRHCITKLSHYHFVAAEEYGRRVVQLGEEPWRVTVSGAPGLDHLQGFPPLSRDELCARFGLRLEDAPLLVTFHPVTLDYERTEWHLGELLAALEQIDREIIFTLPNADTNGRVIVEKIQKFVAEHSASTMVENFGSDAYFSMMSFAAAMVGNSSSGIIEAPSFKLPVVNIGNRQEGRVHAANVIDVNYDRAEILGAVRKALSTEFRDSLKNLVNPFAKGNASELIATQLGKVDLSGKSITKKFWDLPTQRENPLQK